MKGIIWGSTLNRAVNKLDEIVDSYKMLGYQIDTYRKNSLGFFVTFNNGDSWKAIYATESQRGNKCNISYIDNKINNDFVDNVIFFCTVMPPYNAFQYFG